MISVKSVQKLSFKLRDSRSKAEVTVVWKDPVRVLVAGPVYGISSTMTLG